MLVYLIFSLNSSLDKLNQLNSIKLNIENKNKKLLEDIEKLKGEIENIKNNPSYYLKIAREEYFYLKPDEYLYVVISKDGINTQSFEKKERNPIGKGERVKK